MDAPRPPRRRRRLLLALVVVPLLTAAGLELGARALERSRGRPWSAEAQLADLETLRNAVSRRAFLPGGLQDEERAQEMPNTQVLQPYVAWEHLSTQEWIVRGTEHFASDRADATFDVCILGGSVAQGFAQEGKGRLIDLLSRDERLRGREVLVHNYACAGYKQPQQLMFLAYLLALGHEPDLVIELDGFNDSALAWANRVSGSHPVYPYLPFWTNVMQGLRPDWQWAELTHETRVDQDRAIGFGDWLVGSGLWRSCFLGRLGAIRLERLRGDYVASYLRLREHVESRPKDAEVRGPRFPEDEEGAARQIVAAWESASRSMKGVCAERGIAYLHVLQPTLRDDGSKPLTEKEVEGAGCDPAWLEGVRRLYPRLREGGARLAALGVPFLDATGTFRDVAEDLYVDVCHVNQRGNDLLADAIAPAALAAIARTEEARGER